MNKKQFVLDKLEKGNAILSVRITDSVSNDNYFIMTKEAYEDDIDEIVGVLNEQQDKISELEEENRQLNQLLNEAEDLIESRLAEHFAKQYENIKHKIIDDND